MINMLLFRGMDIVGIIQRCPGSLKKGDVIHLKDAGDWVVTDASWSECAADVEPYMTQVVAEGLPQSKRRAQKTRTRERAA